MQLVEDLRLIVTNAMMFNMPKDDPYFRSKVLHILGSRLLNDMREVIEYTEIQMMKVDVFSSYKVKVRQFYRKLNKQYINYLLNHGREGSIIAF